MTARITIHRDGTNYGPYELEQVNSMLLGGRILPSDLAWQEGSSDWVSVSEIPGVAAVPPPPPPAGSGGRRRSDEARVSSRLILPAFLLAFFVGIFGIHRFYVGKNGSGFAMLVLTVTVVGAVVTWVWATVDWIRIVCGKFEDADGRVLANWT
ncbi:MAG: hypothetical protein Fur0037_10960 [Planctomycetota bacterium]